MDFYAGCILYSCCILAAKTWSIKYKQNDSTFSNAAATKNWPKFAVKAWEISAHLLERECNSGETNRAWSELCVLCEAVRRIYLDPEFYFALVVARPWRAKWDATGAFPFWNTNLYCRATLANERPNRVLFVYPSASKSKEESQQPPSECTERNL